jgi:hypothetical protein
VPSRQSHRGPHPSDAELFAPEHWPALAAAVLDLGWLLARGYAFEAAQKLVGDRHQLTARQRKAVQRCCCSEASVGWRRGRQLTLEQAKAAKDELRVDGFNVLITVEAALSGGMVLVGRDGAHRDLASVHGNYRKVGETQRAVELLGAAMAGLRAAWFFDRPVSNSGRLRALLMRLAATEGWDWSVELDDNPDRRLIEEGDFVAASSDAGVLDRCGSWVDLAGAVIAGLEPVWIVDLSTPEELVARDRRDPGE